MRVTYKRAQQLLQQGTFYPEELARVLGTTEQHLFSEVHRGNLKADTFGGDILRFTRRDVLDWLARHQSVRSD